VSRASRTSAKIRDSRVITDRAPGESTGLNPASSLGWQISRHAMGTALQSAAPHMTTTRLLTAAALSLFVAACEYPSPDEPKAEAGKLPSYLLGVYERGSRVENSLALASENIAVEFVGEHQYRYRFGNAWSTVLHELAVTENSVRFETGPLRTAAS
jgi:hypothetical protein